MSYFQNCITDSPDRGADCATSIAPAFKSLAEMAESQGWTSEEVATALLSLSKDHIIKLIASSDVKRLVNERS